MKRIGQRRGDEIVIDMPMTRTDLAEYAGVTVETVSRCFTQLRKANVISLPQPWSVHILQKAELDRLAGN
jgi:CRP-like cAMP-binding protein